MKKTLLLSFFAFFHLRAFAQQETLLEFETDRPTKTEASSVVPRGYFQLETGFQYQRLKHESLEDKQWLYPQALLRIGLLPAAEFRVEATYRQETNQISENLFRENKGLSTLRVGTKVNVLESQGVLPTVSVLAMLELPWEADAFKPNKVAPEVMLLLTNGLSEKVKLQYNAGFQRQREDEEMENKLQYSAALCGKLSEKVTVAAEFFGEKPNHSHAENQIDGSIQFLLLPNLQVDAIVGTGVSSHAPDLFTGGGLSFRLPR
ncbi:transporter [Rufibacter latericius]|uniref:Transporter n=1 Tax=Rufibacter latericius TaxID=2487040 RepID=A0A3M9MEF8_9BACT|nr:transporter [Rufibacter latericius]RNI23008.1 transporter [Rufibacter latericius]